MFRIRAGSTSLLLLIIAASMAIFIACGETEIREVEVVKVVEKEVPVEVVKEVAVEKIV